MKKGFTLLETVIYIALYSILLIGLFNTSYIVLSNLNRNDTRMLALDEGYYIIDRIDSIFSNSTTDTEMKINDFVADQVNIENFVLIHKWQSPNPEFINVSFTINNIPFSLTKYSRL